MKVNFYANYRQVVGSRSIDLDMTDGLNLQALVEEVIRLHPRLRPLLVNETGQLQSHVHIFLNGRDSHYLPEGVATPVAAGDKVDIFPPVAGG
jgi:sulfur-carrier protein